MIHRNDYETDKKRVRSLEDWKLFAQKWFKEAEWPRKSSEQLTAESKWKRGPVRLSGRVWTYKFFPYDLTPEARYEYFLTLREVGGPIKFPDEVQMEKSPELGWRQECPYDEISTDEIGEPICPLCQRRLILERYSD